MNEEIIHNLNERLDRALARGKEIMRDEDFQQRVLEAKDTVESTIRKHPVRSVLIGLAAGYIIGKFLGSDD